MLRSYLDYEGFLAFWGVILSAIGPLKKRLLDHHQIVARPQIHVEIRTNLWTALVRLALCQSERLAHRVSSPSIHQLRFDRFSS